LDFGTLSLLKCDGKIKTTKLPKIQKDYSSYNTKRKFKEVFQQSESNSREQTKTMPTECALEEVQDPENE
jgi:hypothetical protein